MTALLIRNGHLIDPASGIDAPRKKLNALAACNST